MDSIPICFMKTCPLYTLSLTIENLMLICFDLIKLLLVLGYETLYFGIH